MCVCFRYIFYMVAREDLVFHLPADKTVLSQDRICSEECLTGNNTGPKTNKKHKCSKEKFRVTWE